MKIRTTATTTALVAALALTLGACGDDYDADLVDALEAQGASQEEAECFIDEIGEDDAQGFLDNIDADSPPDNADEIIAALDECGVAPDDAGSAETPESTPEETEVTDTDTEGTEDTAPEAGAAIDDIAACLESAGLDVNTDDGPPARIDVLGAGSGAVFFYADAAQASDASGQFIDTFGGGDTEFVSGSNGEVAYYYLNSSDEASQLEGCLA